MMESYGCSAGVIDEAQVPKPKPKLSLTLTLTHILTLAPTLCLSQAYA